MNYIWLLFLMLPDGRVSPVEKEFKIVGYAASWSLEVQNIQFDKLTHVNYAFVLPTASGGLTAVENPFGLGEVVSRARANGGKVRCQTGLSGGEPLSLFALLLLGLLLARLRGSGAPGRARRRPWFVAGWFLAGCGAAPGSPEISFSERPLFVADPQVQLPRMLDWRNHEGNYTTPIRDQNGCYGCYADAVVATMESLIEITRQQPDLNPDLSEQHIVSCIGADGCSGWATAEEALSFVEKAGGVASEGDFPYRASNVACSKLPVDWKTRSYKLVKWERVAKDTESIKQRLLQGPIIVKINLYADFSSYAGGVYKHAWGGTDSYHFVVIVGYNDDEQCFLVKNDWGTDWGEDTYGVTGEKGWVRIGYGESDRKSVV